MAFRATICGSVAFDTIMNIGHFDNKIDVAWLKQSTGENIKPPVDHGIFPDGRRVGAATGEGVGGVAYRLNAHRQAAPIFLRWIMRDESLIEMTPSGSGARASTALR